MKTIVYTEVSKEAEYNLSPTDNKVDFLMAEINEEHKVEHSYSSVLPVISGALPAYEVTKTGATDAAILAALTANVTAEDANGLDLTDDITAELDATFVDETAGDYVATLTVVDVDGDEATVEIPVTVLEEYTVTYNLNGGNIAAVTDPVVVAGVTEGTLVGSAYDGGTPVQTGYVWTAPFWVTTAEGSTDAASQPVVADVTVYAYWVLA